MYCKPERGREVELRGVGWRKEKKKSNPWSVWKKSATEKLPMLLEREAIKTAYADLFVVFNWKVSKQNQERMDFQLVKLFSVTFIFSWGVIIAFFIHNKIIVSLTWVEKQGFIYLYKIEKRFQKSANFRALWSHDRWRHTNDIDTELIFIPRSNYIRYLLTLRFTLTKIHELVPRPPICSCV